MRKALRYALLAGALAVAPGCDGEGGAGSPGASTGGTAGVGAGGATLATGGATGPRPAAGSGGAADAGRGGAVGSGGGTGGGGGAVGTGGAAGGSPSSGGVSGSGGAGWTGGAPGAGGESGSGGKPSTGGITATGGRAGAGGTGGGVIGTGGTTGRDAAADAGPDGKTDGPPPPELPAGVTALFPSPGARDVCPDPVLRIRFASPPKLGSSGKIQVLDESGGVAASVDLAAATLTDTIGGSTFVVLRPAYVDGNEAVVYLKQKSLAYGRTYHVNVAAGAIVPPAGSLAITDSTTWRFTTAAGPPADLSTLAVALDGSGQFCTIQGALDAVPSGRTEGTTLTIANGTYHEIVYVSGKSNLTLRGQDRKRTIVASTNNSKQQGSAASTSNRTLMGFRNTNGLVIENLTIHNLTPQGGSQAEALAMQGCDKCMVRDADILSLQDTLLWSGRIYAKNLYVAGNVDFVWGTGAVYFDTCELKTVGRSGYVVQARNPASTYGYVFVDSKITADAGVTGIVLARIDASVYPASHVAYVNCQMGSHIAPAGWTVTGSGSPRFWEYQSVDATGSPIDVSKRTGGTQISASQAAQMRDPAVVLGGWQPPP